MTIDPGRGTSPRVFSHKSPDEDGAEPAPLQESKREGEICSLIEPGKVRMLISSTLRKNAPDLFSSIFFDSRGR
jgi:hypothetical protein